MTAVQGRTSSPPALALTLRSAGGRHSTWRAWTWPGRSNARPAPWACTPPPYTRMAGVRHCRHHRLLAVAIPLGRDSRSLRLAPTSLPGLPQHQAHHFGPATSTQTRRFLAATALGHQFSLSYAERMESWKEGGAHRSKSASRQARELAIAETPQRLRWLTENPRPRLSVLLVLILILIYDSGHNGGGAGGVGGLSGLGCWT